MSSTTTILSIGGYDPSGGAGVLADIKVFEQLELTGMGVATAITYQNENEFDGCDWLSLEQIRQQLSVLNKRNDFRYIKIGLIESFEVLDALLESLQDLAPIPKVIWDPVLKTSSEFVIHKNIDESRLLSVLKKVGLITPNLDELCTLSGDKGAEYLSQYCDVLVKGGHGAGPGSDDIVYTSEGNFIIPGKRYNNISKHGSGCVFSSALAGFLTKGIGLAESAYLAKEYTRQFLLSSDGLLGLHRNIMIEANVAAE